MSEERCFACNKVLRKPTPADTRDGQTVFVGPECARKIEAAGDEGYQPAGGGPRLFPVAEAGKATRRQRTTAAGTTYAWSGSGELSAEVLAALDAVADASRELLAEAPGGD